MARSGSTNLTITRDDIIRHALQEIGVLAVDETPTASMTTGAAERLNYMVKGLMTHGYNLWTSAEIHVFLVKSQQSYKLGSTSSDHIVYDADLTQTTTTAAVASGATTFAVISVTGMTVGDNIGIYDSANVTSWATISSISSLNVTVDSAVSSGAASGANVYSYTTGIERPQRLFHGIRRESDGTDINIDLVPRKEYWELPDKSTTSTVTQAYYDPQLDNGVLYVWGPSSTGTDQLLFGVQRVIEDFDSSSDNPDFPIEWSEMLIYGLAFRLIGMYSVSDRIANRVSLMANKFEVASEDFDREAESYLQLQPYFRR